MSSSPPRVSVVIPTYRRSQIISRAISSVLAQTFSDFEVIVVDDNGRDHPEQKSTEEVITGQHPDARVVYVKNEKSRGGSGARNVAIKMARGEFMAFLDDDEDWIETKLEQQVEAFEKAEHDVGLIDCGFFDVKPDGRVREARPKMQGYVFERLLAKTSGRAPKLSTVMIPKRVLDSVGPFDETLPAREDYDLYLRIARDFKFDSVPVPLAFKRGDAGPRITSNPENFVRGYERIYHKFKEDYQKRPKTHSVYLLRYAELLALTRRSSDAWDLFMKAARIYPLNPRLITYCLRLWQANRRSTAKSSE